jgi:hypothetical protein
MRNYGFKQKKKNYYVYKRSFKKSSKTQGKKNMKTINSRKLFKKITIYILRE